MSPRAAWWLEAAGFSPVYDYVAGKADWLAADLPFQGTAELAGMFTRRRVFTGPRRGFPVGGTHHHPSLVDHQHRAERLSF